MCCPRPVEGYQTTCVDRAAEDVFWHEFAFVPDDGLVILSVFPLSDIAKPLVVSIVAAAAMLQPFVYQHVCRVVIKRGFDKFSHGETWRVKYGVVSLVRRHSEGMWPTLINVERKESNEQSDSLFVDTVTGHQTKCRPLTRKYFYLFADHFQYLFVPYAATCCSYRKIFCILMTNRQAAL
jgi:hypothetical protein